MVVFDAMTEKRKPTHNLEAIKAAFSTIEKLRVTGSALKGALYIKFTAEPSAEYLLLSFKEKGDD